MQIKCRLDSKNLNEIGNFNTWKWCLWRNKYQYCWQEMGVAPKRYDNLPENIADILLFLLLLTEFGGEVIQ